MYHVSIISQSGSPLTAYAENVPCENFTQAVLVAAKLVNLVSLPVYMDGAEELSGETSDVILISPVD